MPTNKTAVLALIFSFLLISSKTSAQPWNWARAAVVHETTAFEGGTHAPATATDKWGNVFEIVTFYGDSVSFGSHTIIPGGAPGVYHGALVKYDSTGSVCWAKYIAEIASTDHITMDRASNIYITGRFSTPTLTLSSGVYTRMGATTNYFLIKFDSSGNIIWAKTNGITWDGVDVKTDKQCNVYLAGDFGGTIYYGTDTFTHGPYGNDVMLLKYDSSGSYVWGRAVGAGHSRALSLAIDPEKNAYICGYYGAPFVFAGDTARLSGTSGYFDNYLLKYDSSGTPKWLRSTPTHDINSSEACTDNNGNVYLISSFATSSSMVIGTYTLTPAGSGDVYVAKYTGAGNVVWAKKYGGTGQDYGRHIIIDPASYLWISGSTRSATFTAGALSMPCDISTNGSAFIVRLDTNGNALHMRSFRNGGYNLGNAISNDRFGGIFLCGAYMNGDCIIGMDTLVAVTVPSPYCPVMQSTYIAKIGNAFVPPCPAISFSGGLLGCPSSGSTLSSTPEDGLWASGSTGIATINAETGAIVGVAPGTAEISYMLSPTCFATQVFTVNALPVAGSIAGAGEVFVSSSITLTNSSAGGVWTSSNTAIATVSPTGDVYGINPGSVVITYTITNSCGAYFVTKTITVLQSPASLHAQVAGATIGFNLFPNPASQNVTISFQYAYGTLQNAAITITDVSGRQVARILPGGPAESIKIETGHWRTGIYIVRMEENGTAIMQQQMLVIN